MLDRCPSEPDDPFAPLERRQSRDVRALIRFEARPTYRDEAWATIRSLGSHANYLVPLGILGPFSQWLKFPDWMREGTSLGGAGPLPLSLTQRDDTIILANMLDHGHGPSMLGRALASDRLVTGPNVSLIVRNAPTLRDAMENVAVALGATNPNIHATFSVDGGEAQFDVEGRVAPGRLLDFIAAMRIILALRAVERFLLRRADEARLQLTLSQDFVGDLALDEITGEVEFSSNVNRLTFPADWIERPNSDHDRVLWTIARQRVHAMQRSATDRDLASRLRERVAQVLSAEKRVPRLKELAADLGMTDRTVGRKLAALGVRFQDIVNEERKSLIEQYLADPSVGFTLIAKHSGSAAFPALAGLSGPGSGLHLPTTAYINKLARSANDPVIICKV